MNKATPIDTISERLRAVIKAGTGGQVDQAKALLMRLGSPVRVVLMGFPGGGKFATLNSLLKDNALPEAAQSVTTELRFGPQIASEITRAGGAVLQREGALRDGDLQDAAFISVEQPIPLLKKINFMNLVADGTPDQQTAAINWVSKRVDIAIWCSQRFGPYDREVWARVPDVIKDHAFLLLSASDMSKSEEVKSRYRDQFLDIYSVDFAQSANSGVAAVLAAIEQHADHGRQADLDSAYLFLKSLEGRGAKARKPSPGARGKPPPKLGARKSASEAAKAAHKAAPVAKAPPAQEPAPAKPAIPVETAPPVETTVSPHGHDAPEPVAAPPRPTVGWADHIGNSAPKLPQPIFNAGFSFLRSNSLRLLDDFREDRAMKAQPIVKSCRETMSKLSEIVSDLDEGGDPAVTALGDMIMDAEDMIVLLENEKGDEAAIDALSLLLQVRQEFECRANA